MLQNVLCCTLECFIVLMIFWQLFGDHQGCKMYPFCLQWTSRLPTWSDMYAVCRETCRSEWFMVCSLWVALFALILFRWFTTPCKPPIGITSMKSTEICVALLWGVGLVYTISGALGGWSRISCFFIFIFDEMLGGNWFWEFVSFCRCRDKIAFFGRKGWEWNKGVYWRFVAR